MDIPEFQILESEKRLEIRHSDYQLVFGTDSRLTFEQFTSNNNQWLSPFGDCDALWKLHLQRTDGTAPIYMSNLSVFNGVEVLEQSDSGGKILFKWDVPLSNEGKCRVCIRLECRADSCLTKWYFSAELPTDYYLNEIDFPLIPNLKMNEGDCFYSPTGFGLEHLVEPGFGYTGHYPSWEAGFQMAIFSRGDYGLYLAAHDPKANLKNFIFQSTAGRSLFQISHLTVAEIPENKTYTLDFPLIIGFYQGSCYDAAQLYKPFSYETPWGGEDAKIKNRPIPEWIKKAQLCLRPKGSTDDNLPVIRKAEAFFDCDMFYHWYHWHEIPYDTFYPEYFPPKKGFEEGIEAVHELGSHMFCYINGRLWDPQSKSWHEENGADYAAKKEDGKCYTEIYGNCIPNNTMCPYTEKWQQKIAGVVETLIKKYGLDGVYIDQIGAAMGVPCYNKNHGHPIGGGHFWRDGYVSMLNEIRKRIGHDVILITEENAECWINQIDVHLTVNTPSDGLRPVPLYPVIYSDRTILIGSQYYSPDEPQNALSFCLKNGRAFLWGSIHGWIEPFRIMDEGSKESADYLKELSDIRPYATEFQIGGEFLGMIKIGGDNPIIKQDALRAFGGKYLIEEPSVLGSAWKGQNGRTALFLTNYTSEDRTVEVEIDLLNISGSEWIKLDSSGSAEELNAEKGKLIVLVRAGKALIIKTK